jgi:hypothetical protein
MYGYEATTKLPPPQVSADGGEGRGFRRISKTVCELSETTQMPACLPASLPEGPTRSGPSELDTRSRPLSEEVHSHSHSRHVTDSDIEIRVAFACSLRRSGPFRFLRSGTTHLPSPAPFCFFPVAHPVSYTSAGTDQADFEDQAQRLGMGWAVKASASEYCSTGI